MDPGNQSATTVDGRKKKLKGALVRDGKHRQVSGRVRFADPVVTGTWNPPRNGDCTPRMVQIVSGPDMLRQASLRGLLSRQGNRDSCKGGACDAAESVDVVLDLSDPRIPQTIYAHSPQRPHTAYANPIYGGILLGA